MTIVTNPATPRRLVIASNNVHKITELQTMLGRARDPVVRDLVVTSAGALGFGDAPDIDETSSEFIGNAMLKAQGIAAWLRELGAAADDDLVLADDSGLCVEILDGEPGVYSARFAGFHADDETNNGKLVSELQARGVESSPAEYVCVLAVRRVGQGFLEITAPDAGNVSIREDCLCIEGRCSGTVRIDRRGTGGFGYDPHFWIDGGSRTFAELSASEKSQRSHRGGATRALVRELPLLLGGRPGR